MYPAGNLVPETKQLLLSGVRIESTSSWHILICFLGMCVIIIATLNVVREAWLPIPYNHHSRSYYQIIEVCLSDLRGEGRWDNMLLDKRV